MLLIVLMGAKIDEIYSTGWLFRGAYEDFSEEWYVVIGNFFISTIAFYTYYPFGEYALEVFYKKLAIF